MTLSQHFYNVASRVPLVKTLEMTTDYYYPNMYFIYSAKIAFIAFRLCLVSSKHDFQLDLSYTS